MQRRLALLVIMCMHLAAAVEPLPSLTVPNGLAPGKAPYLVFAHYMPCNPPLGLNPSNTYWYGERISPASDNQICWPVLTAREGTEVESGAFIDEILLAKSYGIDGFFVDQLEDNDAYRACWRNLLKAAEIVGDFKIGLMPDYSTLWGNVSNGTAPEKILRWLAIAGSSPALLRYDGKPAVMPYGCAFPDAKGAPAQEKLRIADFLASKGITIAYAALHGLDWALYAKPFANDAKTGFQTFAFATGSFSPTCGTDLRQRALDYWPADLMTIGEVSFMYYNRGWCYNAPRLSATYRAVWEWNIVHRDRIRWMQIITWNDHGESAIQPTCNHFMAWQRLTRFYADWFRSGRRPTLTKDWLAVFHRPHPYAAEPVLVKMTLTSGTPTDDVEALALLTAPATLVMESGGRTSRLEVGAGLQSFVTPFAAGVQSARIERNGTQIVTVTTAVPVHLKPARQNLWFIGADSDHPPRPLTVAWPDQAGWTGEAMQRSGSGLIAVGDSGRWLDMRVEATVVPTLHESGIVVRKLDQRHVQLTVHRDGVRLLWRLAARDGATITELSSGSRPSPTGPVRLRLDSVADRVVPYCDGDLLDGDSYVFAPFHGQVGLIAAVPATFSSISVQTYDLAVPVR